MSSPAVTANPATPSAIWIAGFLGLLASILVGAAEFSLHFTPSLDYSGPEYEFFLTASRGRLAFGHFTAILAAPLYFAGYWHLFQRLRPAPALMRTVVLVAGIYSFAMGQVWIGSRVYLALLIQQREIAANEAAREQIATLLQDAAFFNETILIALRIGILLVSVFFIYLVAAGKTAFPRWMAALNPILLVIGCFVIYAVVPAIGGYLMPIAMNVAHFVLFSASLLLMKRKPEC